MFGEEGFKHRLTSDAQARCNSPDFALLREEFPLRPPKAQFDMLVGVFQRSDRQPEMHEGVFDCFPDMLHYIKDAQARYLSDNQTLITRSGMACDDVIGERAKQPFLVTGANTNTQDLVIFETRSPILNRLRLHSSGLGHRCRCLSSRSPILNEDGLIDPLTQKCKIDCGLRRDPQWA